MVKSLSIGALESVADSPVLRKKAQNILHSRSIKCPKCSSLLPRMMWQTWQIWPTSNQIYYVQLCIILCNCNSNTSKFLELIDWWLAAFYHREQIQETKRSRSSRWPWGGTPWSSLFCTCLTLPGLGSPSTTKKVMFLWTFSVGRRGSTPFHSFWGCFY